MDLHILPAGNKFNNLLLFKKRMGGKGKKGQVWDTLIPWIIAVAVLVLMIIIFMILKGKGTSAITYLKNLLRFGR